MVRYGQRGDSIGASREKTKNILQAVTRRMLVVSTLGWTVEVKKQSPTKDRAREAKTMSGNEAVLFAQCISPLVICQLEATASENHSLTIMRSLKLR